MKPALLLAVAYLLVTGCGTVDSGGDAADRSVARGSDTELTITVRPGDGRGARTYTLTCDPPGGAHPDAEAACRLLAELEDPFAPVPPDAMCTEIYGGPQTATVKGTLRGERVDAEFSRTDGCQIARWDKHATLLVETGGADLS